MADGEIWLADLDPRRGPEPGTTRLLLIVRSRALMQASRGRLRPDSDLLIDQIRAIDNHRLVGRAQCRAPGALLLRIGEAIREGMDLVD